MLKESIYVREITAADTHLLRQSVLRDGNTQNIEFTGDEDLSTLHLGAFFYGKVIGIASYYNRHSETLNSILSEENREHLLSIPYRQLRGMAVEKEYRGMDVGRKLIEDSEKRFTEKDNKSIIWCNARTVAIGFYEKQGFRKLGEEFQIEDVGPHYIMYKVLG